MDLPTLSGGTWRAFGELPNVENIIATDYADKVWGDGGNNIIRGGNGNDILYGKSGDDTLYGGGAVDTLYGEAGSDTFTFESSSAFTNTDNIQDFSIAQNDAINIADLLTGYDPLTDLITDFVQITNNGTDSVLAVDSDGGADNFVQIATIINNIGLTDEQALETSGNLIAV